MRRELEVLVLEDDLEDEAFIEEQLQKIAPGVHAHRVETLDELVNELRHHPLDLAILDHGQPALSARKALSLVKQQRPEMPCIAIVSDADDLKSDWLKDGAVESVPKDRLSGLGPAVRRVLEIDEPREGKILDTCRYSEEQLRLFIEAARDYAIYMLDPQGCVASWNSGAQRLEGYEADEVLGQHLSLFFSPDAIAQGQPQKELADARLHGHSQSEGWCRRKDGTLFWSQWSLAAVRDQRGELVGYLRIAHDVTPERRAQHELEKLNKQLSRRVRERTRELEDLNNELEAFTYSVAHDLRAPLRHINSFAEQLKGHTTGKLESEDREYLEVISRSARTLSEMVAALLNLSRLGRKPLDKVPVNLTRIVRHIVDELKPDVGDREVQWFIDELPEVNADPTLMRQVFLNLIGNALKYTRDRNPSLIEIGHTDSDREHIVCVRDNGVGFPAELVGKLFGVFQRLHRGDEFEGTGVGLAIVRRVIQKHGGRTWAEGQSNRGATFCFSLPK